MHTKIFHDGGGALLNLTRLPSLCQPESRMNAYHAKLFSEIQETRLGELLIAELTGLDTRNMLNHLGYQQTLLYLLNQWIELYEGNDLTNKLADFCRFEKLRIEARIKQLEAKRSSTARRQN